MAYDWDGGRTRRVRYIKILLLIAIAGCVALPLLASF